MATSLEITLPTAGNEHRDLQYATQPAWQDALYENKDDLFGLLNVFNKYIWFALGVVAMFVLIYAGIKLITARGDEKEMKKVNTTLISLIIGVLIAILSYVLVKIVANVF